MRSFDWLKHSGRGCARFGSQSRGRVSRRPCVGALVLLIASGNVFGAGWNKASIERLGLFSGPEFTRNDGYQTSIGNTPIDGKWIFGESTRYNGGPAELGKASWIWSAGAGTARVGLFTGSEFTSSGGTQSTFLGTFSAAAGRFIGYSERFLGEAESRGFAVWTWTSSDGTQRIGLHGGSEFTRGDGFQNVFADSVNIVGRIAGDSTRYNGGAQSQGNATWTWDSVNGTVRIGLHGAPEFTRAGGEQWSFRQGLTTAGIIGGYSHRYNGGTEITGRAAWAWREGVGTERIGLFAGSEFTGQQSEQYASITSMNAAGRMVGVSTRYGSGSPGGISTGQATWVWDAAFGTVRTGLTGAGYLRADGFAQSDNVGLQQSGRVRGTSQRYSGLQSSGQATWVWTQAAGTVRTGLHSSPEFTRSDGFEHSAFHSTPDAALRLVGISNRYAGATAAGQATWTWDLLGGTVRTGLFGGLEFTSSNGTQSSWNQLVTADGRITGSSQRYLGAAGNAGEASWTWDATNGTVRTGLYSAPEFASDSGFQRSTTHWVTESGRISGTSTRFNGGSIGLGTATWTWDATYGTVRTGLYDGPEFTASNGTQVSVQSVSNNSGIITGRSTRFMGAAAAMGFATWAWSESAGTVRTGLFDASHTSDAGVQSSTNLALHASGLVLGTSDRYAGGPSVLSQTVWAFDPFDGVLYPLVFSLSDDGRSSTSIVTIAPNDWVLGTYDVFSGNAVSSTNAFIWSVERGFADLGSIVDGGLAANGWSNLFNTYGADGVELVIGHGRLLGTHAETQAVFALRGVPGPGSVSLLAVAGLGSSARRKRRA